MNQQNQTDPDSRQRCSVKKVFLEISQNSQENTCARDSFLIKFQACNFIKKESLAQVFSCEFCEISKDNFFTEHLRTTASGLKEVFLKYHRANYPFGQITVSGQQ